METAFDPYHKWLGIPSDRQPPDHYTLLAVQVFEKDPDVIDSAADQRMSHLRKFQTGQHSDLSQKLLNEVANARVCLLNAAKKAEYDRKLHEEYDRQLPPRAPIFPDVPFDPPEPMVALPYGTRHAKSKAAKNLVVPYVVVLSVGGSLLALCVILLCWRTPKTQVIIDWSPAEREGAKVTIDGKPVTVPASGPFVVVCEPGRHDLSATGDRFEPYRQSFYVARGKTVTISEKPSPVKPEVIARVIIDWPPAERQGATVTVDGTPVIVPASDPFVVRCEPGQHNLVAAREGFHTDRQQFHVVGGQTATIRIRLVPVTPAPESSLVFDWPSSHRQGVKVSVDGKRVDDFPETGALKVACTAGEHTVRAEWPASLLEWEIPVRTREEVEVPAPMLLELDWPVGERSEAKLLIDGKTYSVPMGAPDCFVIALKSDSESESARIDITRPGYRLQSNRTVVQLVKGGIEQIPVKFEPLPPIIKEPDDGGKNKALAATISAVQEDPRPDEETLNQKLQKEFGRKTVRLSGSIKSARVSRDRYLCDIDFFLGALSSLAEQSRGKAEIIVRPGLKTSIARDLKSELSEVKTGDPIFFEGKFTSEVINCRTCDGTGNAPCPECVRGFIPCGACKGRGEKKVQENFVTDIITPNGTIIHLPGTRWVWKKCPNCQGSKGFPCKNCRRTGSVKCEHKVDPPTWNPFDKKDPLSGAIASVSFSHNRRLCFLYLKDISVWVNSGAPPKKIVLRPLLNTVEPKTTIQPPPSR